MPINQLNVSRPALPLVTFTWSPVGTSLTYIIGGNSYAYGSMGPRFAAFVTPTNTAITFVATATVPSSIGIINYEWSFGDGQYGAGQTVAHTYVAPIPNIEASVTVTDSLGRQITRNKVLNLRHSTQIGVSTFIARVAP